MKVIVAHPSKQHSFYTAIALKQGNMLFRYITSVYDKPGTLTHFFKRFLSSKNRKKASTRKTTELLDSDVLVQSELCGLLLLIIRRVPFLRKKLYHNLFRWRRRVFGEFVAKYAIENEVDAVIMYDSTAVECFSVLKEKAPNIIRILDVSIAHRLFMRKVFEQDADRMKDNNIVKEESILWNDTLMKEYVQEVIDSNYFLSPSNVVKESLLYVGAPEQKIKIIPYGVDLNKFLFVPKKQHNLPLKLIFVGQIIYRKGIHHLLNIVSQFSSSEIILQLVGNYDSKSELYIQYKDCSNIKFLGFATRDILAKCYQESDIFILPTLGEGLALVILESLSTGTPVISSNLSGGNDYIENGYNGFVFNAGDDKELKDILLYFINNMDIIPELSCNAYKSVQNMSWESYYIKVQQVVNEILGI